MVESIRVLHVDDEPDFADLTATFLEREDDRMTVDTASSASEGMDQLAEKGFDCIVSDYDMPGQSGIEFLESVREEYPDLPFILFTGKGSEEVADEAISAGATNYLRKGSGTDRYELLANRIRNAIDQYRSTRRATDLDRMRTLVGDINQALVRADSREEAETRVCEIISGSDPYTFAWIGEVDPGTDRIEPRTWAGVEEGYLDAITVTADDDPAGRGPGWTAIHEQRVAVSQNVREDPEFEPWREEATKRGYRAVAVVPLEYENHRYGVLGVYAQQPNAFDEAEQELLAELGDDIAHAVAAFETRDALEDTRERMQLALEHTDSLLFEVDFDTGTVTRHGAFREYFDLPPDEVPTWEDVLDRAVHPEDQDAFQRFYRRLADGDRDTGELEYRTTPETEDVRWIRANVYVEESDDGSRRAVGLAQDITGRKKRERKIDELNSTTRALMQAGTPERIADITVDALRDILDMPVNGVYRYDDRHGCLSPVAWTDRGEELVDEVPTFHPGEGLAWEVFETGEAQIYDDVSSVPSRLEPGTSIRSEIILPLGDHGVLLIGSSEPDVFDETDVSLAQTLAAHVTTALDRIDRDQELARQRSLLEAQQEAVLDGMLVVDDDSEIISYNHRFVDLWEIPRGIVERGDNDEALDWVTDHLVNPEEFLEKIDYLYEHPEATARDEIELTDGRVFDRYTTPLVGEDGTHYGRLWTFRDITERKERERELKRNKRIVQEMNDGVVVVQEGIIRYTNPQVSELVGYAPGELRGQPMGEFIAPDDRDTVQQRFQERVAGNEPPSTYEISVLSKDGERIPVEITAGRVEHDGQPATVSIVRDITERKERERELDRQNERLEEFASVVSHDLRNPLNVANGRLELIREEYDSEQLDGVARAHERMEALIGDLLTLAREGKRVEETEAVDLADIAENCWRNVDTAEATLAAGTNSTIQADRSRLQQLLENLMRNAVEHGDAGVTVTIDDLDDEGFYVADDGPGIPEDERENVFERGYSTSADGTGFGLSIVEQIGNAHDWEVRVTDSDGGGARFEITGVEFVQCSPVVDSGEPHD